MGCTPSRVLPDAPATATTSAPASAVLITESAPALTGQAVENEVQPFRPTSSSSSQTPQTVEVSPAVVRPMHHSQPSQSLRPSEFSASQQQASPRSQAQLSPSSQHTASAGSSHLPLFAPPAASSAPRVSILKAPGDRKKKDWDAIRAAKQATVSPHHAAAASSSGIVNYKGGALAEEKELEQQEASSLLATEEQKEQQTPPVARRNIIRTQSSSSQVSQPVRLSRPQSIPTAAATQSGDSPPSQSPSHAVDGATKSARSGSAANSRQNSFRTPAGGAKKKKRRTSHQGMMSKLALQFPAVRQSFAAVYSSFQQFCHLSASPASAAAPSSALLPSSLSALGHISLEKFPALLEHLTHQSCSFTGEQVHELFALSHVEHSATLTFRECLIAIALGYYLAAPHATAAVLGSPPAAVDPNFDRIARGFKVIRSAFDEIDDDSSGMLSADEMKQALFAASSGQSKDDVLQARFHELDINGDGDVEFKEFLYGVVSWVGMTSEEELDDIEQSA